MASFFDDWNELAQNQKSDAEVAADSLQQGLSTLYDFKLSKMSMEHGFRQDAKRDMRADKSLLLESFRTAQVQFKDDPVGYYNWTKTDEAYKAGNAAGIANWADVIDEAGRDADAYTQVNTFRNDFYKANDSTRMRDYTLGSIREHKSIAANLGTAGEQLNNSLVDIENSFIATQKRTFGKQSAEKLYEWAVDKNLLQDNTQFSENIKQAIASGNHVLANQLILTELKDKKANETEVMEMYSLQQRLSAAQYSADNDIDAYNVRNTALRNDIKNYFGNILDRQLSVIPGDPPPESPVLGFSQKDDDDDVVLGATNFRTDEESLKAVQSYVGKSWSGDPNTLMLGDDWYVSADINNSGKFKKMKGRNVRNASADRLGRIKLNDDPESRKKWYATITNKYQYTDDGKLIPESVYQKAWKRSAYTSKDFSNENRVMKPIVSGDVISDKKTGNRFVVVSKSYGPSTGTIEKVTGRGTFRKETKIYTTYDHRKSTISIQSVDDYEKGVTKNIKTISFHDLQRQYGLGLLRLPMQIESQSGNDPLGLDLF